MNCATGMMIAKRRQVPYSRLVLSSTTLLLLVFSITFVQVQPLENSIASKKSGITDDATQTMKSLLVGGWGLPDSVAVVGRLFQYRLPTYDIDGNYSNYKVTVVGENNYLPRWLLFDEQTSSIEGVPLQEDIGHMHNIQVTADCVKLTGGRIIPIKEYFTIKVSDKGVDDNVQLDYAPLKEVNSGNDVGLVTCKPDASITTATVIVDVDGSSLTARDRVKLLRSLCLHLRLPATLVRVTPLQDRPIVDDSALVAGPGDTKHPTHAGIMVQWDVGCGNVYAKHMPILEMLEVTSNNGTMTKAVGYGIVGWHITSKRRNLLPRRLKRQFRYGIPTATPMPSYVRPSGRPVPTMTITDTSFTDVPETRIVPTTASAVSPGMASTSPGVIPSWPPSKETSKVRPSKISKSPTPTTTYVTITPTRVLTIMSSTVSIIGSTTTPSKSVDEIEPSISTEAPGRFSSTEILPSWTTAVFITEPVLVTVFPSMVESTLITESATPSKLPIPKVTRRPPKTPRPSETPTSTPAQNMAPTVSRPLGIIDAVVGNLLLFKIPDDTFTDREEGNTLNLTLLFLQDENDQEVDPSSWIKLNETSHTLYGLPLEEHIGIHHYQLAGVDREGKLAKTPCSVSVQAHPASHKTNHELSVTLDMDYDKVIYDLATRVNLINKIASAFGDKDSRKMTVTRISRGSVEIAWTNNTIPFEPCPKKELEALVKVLLLPDGNINETFAKSMEPYRITKAGAKLLGSCALDHVTTSIPPDDTTTMKASDGFEGKTRVQASSDVPLYILIPLIIFAVLLLLLIIICAVCYKQQMKRRKDQDKLNGLHKGIPIIFAEELEDKQETPTSTLKSRSPEDEEKQSVPPPEYPRSKPGSQSSTLRSDYKSPLISDNEDHYEADDLGRGASSAPPTLPRQHFQKPQEQTTTPQLHFSA